MRRFIDFLYALTLAAVALAVLFASTKALADSEPELEQVYFGYRSFFNGGTDYLLTNNGLPDREIGKEISLHMDVKFLEYFYWHNTVHGRSDQYSTSHEGGQFRSVGYQFELGLHATSFLDLEYHHHSQHTLDTTMPFHFPVEDSIGFNIIFYRAKSRPDSLF